MANEAPLTRKLELSIDPQAAATDGTFPFVDVPFPATVTGVSYTPNAAVTGANTNTRTLSLIDKGAAGSGNTVVASLALASGTNLSADMDNALTLSGTAANLIVAAGDVLVFSTVHAGTGLADPGGLVTVQLSRNDG